eukprot:1769740-Pyramimonas_sp.AAC.1
MDAPKGSPPDPPEEWAILSASGSLVVVAAGFTFEVILVRTNGSSASGRQRGTCKILNIVNMMHVKRDAREKLCPNETHHNPAKQQA